jgi:hypothetical protein
MDQERSGNQGDVVLDPPDYQTDWRLSTAAVGPSASSRSNCPFQDGSGTDGRRLARSRV